jgi:integrase
VSALAERFAGEHFTLNSISERRQGQVLTALARFEAFLIDTPLEDATDNDLRAWLVSLLGEGLAPSTVAWHLKMVKPFYRWCWQRRVISADDFLRLRYVAPPRGYDPGVPRPYSRKELRRLWAELDARFPYAPLKILKRYHKGTSPFRSVKRHAMRLQLDAMIDLALVCGLRRGEIYALSIDDCHWDNKYIVVHGKRVDQNPKVREVPYPDSTRAAITRWWHFRVSMGPVTNALWLSVTGPDPAAALTEDRMHRILHSFGDWQLHRLRHTCATGRLRGRNAMTLEQLQRFLGHASLAQTLRYAELTRSDIHRASARIDGDFQAWIRPAA